MRSAQSKEEDNSSHAHWELPNDFTRAASAADIHGTSSAYKERNKLQKAPRNESHFGNMTDGAPNNSVNENEDELMLPTDAETHQEMSKDRAMGSELEILREGRSKTAGNGHLSMVRHRWAFLLSLIFLVILLCSVGREGGKSAQEDKIATDDIQFESSASMYEWSHHQTKQVDGLVDESTGTDTDTQTVTKVTSEQSPPSPTSSPSPYPSFIWGNYTDDNIYFITKPPLTTKPPTASKPPLITKPPTDPPVTSTRVSKKKSKSKSNKSTKKTQTAPSQTASKTSSPTNEGDLSGLHHSFQGKKPNFLVILADDVGTGDLPFYWQSSMVRMPHLSRLAKMGVTFMDAHSTPLCAPSRYMFLSGNYQHRGRSYNGRWNLAYSNNQFQPYQKSIAEVLRDQAGYHTAMFGKVSYQSMNNLCYDFQLCVQPS